ncbi:peroxisomal fatty acid beta-oxidation multifunctional protein-like [Zingiber officinale]|uniref:peroxisomal fatty acid beta-oxidation multifunctional protein-like n=1 Tax=Zingiber officinale TaxID=94328 RepID=UPI001C4AECBB|nr:peroxisomal fatty acid beta-oxidation multifunctional protein-like [Zingiber officinale]
MESVRVAMEVGSDGVAVITICNPPVNALSSKIVAGLKEKYAEAMSRSDVKAIVLTGQGGKFCGGFDINVFSEIQKTGDPSLLPDLSIELVVNTIEDAPKPTVAAIQGLALGGGLELAMGCHSRISTPEAQFGLPELSLGVIPGMGGTQRFPRLVGLQKATEMLLLSKTIIAKEAKSYGLIDDIASANNLLYNSRRWALEISQQKRPRISSLQRTDRLGSLSEVHKILEAARKLTKMIAPNMPQHKACLDAIEEGVNFGGYAGLLKEAKISKELILSSTTKGLIHSFFSQRAVTKVPNITNINLQPRKIKKVAVIGGGLMGSGIATCFIINNISVTLKELNSSFLQKGLKTIEGNLEGFVKKGLLTHEKMKSALSILKGVLDYSEFIDVDMVIECVVEDVSLKQSIFVDIERMCPPHCIFATNTSTIDLNIIGQKTQSQDRIIGAHFFSPAHVMPLLEIVRTDKTSPQVILDLITVGKAIRKVPIVVNNCTGFAVNRTFFPYSQGAQFLVNLGVDLFRIDRVLTSFGMPMGPFLLQDVAGYGVALAVKHIFASAFKGRTFESELYELMVKNGRHGKSNGKGFYMYEKGRKPVPDNSVQTILDECRRRASLMPSGKVIDISDQEVLEMILFPVVNEACRVLDEGVVIQASDLDIASVLGMSFPKYRGGIVFWADSVGSGNIYAKLNKWADTYGDFFRPSAYLEERAIKGLPLSMQNVAEAEKLRCRI